jgi:hypothetical protein
MSDMYHKGLAVTMPVDVIWIGPQGLPLGLGLCFLPPK